MKLQAIPWLVLVAAVLCGQGGEAKKAKKGLEKAPEMIQKGLFKVKVKDFCPKDAAGKAVKIKGDRLIDNEIDDAFVEAQVPDEGPESILDIDPAKDTKKAERKAAHGAMKTMQFFCAGDIRTVCQLGDKAALAQPSCPEIIMGACPQCFPADSTTLDQACLCTCQQANAAVAACVKRRKSVDEGTKPPTAAAPPAVSAPPTAAGAPPAVTAAPTAVAAAVGRLRVLENRKGPGAGAANATGRGKGNPHGMHGSSKAVLQCFETNKAALSQRCTSALAEYAKKSPLVPPAPVAPVVPVAPAPVAPAPVAPAPPAGGSSGPPTAAPTDPLANAALAVVVVQRTGEVFDEMGDEDDDEVMDIALVAVGSLAGVVFAAEVGRRGHQAYKLRKIEQERTKDAVAVAPDAGDDKLSDTPSKADKADKRKIDKADASKTGKTGKSDKADKADKVSEKAAIPEEHRMEPRSVRMSLETSQENNESVAIDIDAPGTGERTSRSDRYSASSTSASSVASAASAAASVASDTASVAPSSPVAAPRRRERLAAAESAEAKGESDKPRGGKSKRRRGTKPASTEGSTAAPAAQIELPEL
jgi:hypothetical protein